MDAIQNIMSRRSIRKYSGEGISSEQIQTIISAAMQAPSAGNRQPWYFIVVQDRQILDAIQKIHPYSNMLNDASCAIVVCADTKIELYTNYWAIECAAATQNILLAAHAIGLGAVWLGVYPREERMEQLKILFELPDNIEILSIVSVGHPAETKEEEDRFKSERVHYNKW
jgi:nitroreductase